MNNSIIDSADFLRAAVYPDRCCLCGKVVEYESKVCPSCRKEAAVIQGDKCICCGLLNRECSCNGKSNFYDGITAPFMYSGIVRRGIKLWKYNEAEYSTEFFAEMIVSAVRETYNDITFDVVTYIPQTEDETEERGYNQCQKLAEAVGAKLDLPVSELLFKKFKTRRQHDLKWFLKSGNVFGVFDCKSEDEVKDKVILLIDDIKTTGITLNECAKMLHIHNAAKVYSAVIAVAEKQKQG